MEKASKSKNISAVLSVESTAIYNGLPLSTIIVDSTGSVVLINREAKKYLFNSNKDERIENIDINSIVVSDMSGVAFSLINNLKTDETKIRKALVRIVDGRVICVDLYISPVDSNPQIYQIQFVESDEKNHLVVSELVSLYTKEVLKLRPYLNKPGKQLLSQLVINEISTGIEKSKLNKRSQLELLNEQFVAKLSSEFPQLSHNELILCGFFSQKLTIDEIATITGKTSNCLRVSFHRIVRKSGFSNMKTLLLKLEELVK